MGEVGRAIGYALEDFALVVDPCRHAVGDMVTEKVYDPRLPPTNRIHQVANSGVFAGVLHRWPSRARETACHRRDM